MEAPFFVKMFRRSSPGRPVAFERGHALGQLSFAEFKNHIHPIMRFLKALSTLPMELADVGMKLQDHLGQ
jgi:hypothetical protein